MSDSSTPSRNRAPHILIFDSGLGGLTVHAEVVRLRPSARMTYAADDAVFPYGRLSESDLVGRVDAVMADLVAHNRPDVVIIACNTASTLVLPHLRARWPALPFVGTVPAIKPAAERSRSHMISVLATPGTVARDYTRGLIDAFASNCAVTLVGASELAPLAENFMQGGAVEDADIAREIAPCFVEAGAQRTDTVVLACTHYPLLIESFRRLAPWPVDWIDPAPAIARRADHVLIEAGFPPDHGEGSSEPGEAQLLSGRKPGPALARVLAARGLSA